MYTPYTPSSNNNNINNNNNSSNNNSNNNNSNNGEGQPVTSGFVRYLPNNKYWTEATISNWVDAIYSQSEIYIKFETDRIKAEASELQGLASIHLPASESNINNSQNNVNINNENNTINNTTTTTSTTPSLTPMNVDNSQTDKNFNNNNYYINTRSKEKAKRELQTTSQ